MTWALCLPKESGISFLYQVFNTVQCLSKPMLSGSFQEGINSLPLMSGGIHPMSFRLKLT